jgi:xanthine dehydrogenase iron-sulfur cluster and FAD-binding subunit A
LNLDVLLREVEYARPATVEEAISLLGSHDGARPLAGGQTLVNVMKQRAAAPDVLVDLADLDELRSIGFSSGGMLEIGAMVTYAQLEGSSEVDVARPILAEVAATIADVQVRNRGTIGGNVCVSDPTNHFPPLLAALDATFTIRGSGGERTIAADGQRPALQRRGRRLRRPHDRRARDVHRQRGRDGLGRQRARRDRVRRRDSGAGDRDGGAARRRGLF